MSGAEQEASPRPRPGAHQPWAFGSGPDVAWVFHRALALLFLVAWLSLGVQVRLLIGSRGLLPLGDFVDAARSQGLLGFGSFPSWLVLAPRDPVIVGGTVVGAALAVLALAGVATRLCLALQIVLYLGYAVACRSFLGFQWDNLLLEAGSLAVFLPADRAAPLAHLLFRALLFKLYFESGLAKWQSPIGDWRDGSAMTFYYQTAPLPTALAWFAHHLPMGWHHFESRATLVLELVLPFAIFGPRRARLAAGAAFTLFQIANAATANYGFFCYLSVVLHLFLLDDRDVRVAVRLRESLRRRVPLPGRIRVPIDRLAAWLRTHARFPRRAGLVTAWTGAALWGTLSLAEALFTFSGLDPAAGAARPLATLVERAQPFRLVDTYHLFAAVTRERIEPELQVATADGGSGAWRPLDFAFKAGPVDRLPPLVAPHQPRVDFLLWFHGLGFARRQPAYVSELLGRLCEDPSAVSSLFTSPPPAHVRAVRIVFWDYRFTTPAERRATAAWWSRRQIHTSAPVACSPASSSSP